MTLKQDYRICCFCPAVIRLHHSNRRPRLRFPPSSDVVVPQTTPGCRRQSSSFLHPPILRSTLTTHTLLLLLLLLLYFSPSPSLRPKVFLFPPLAVEEGEGSLFAIRRNRRRRELSFLIFHGSSRRLIGLLPTYIRAANELLLSALVLSYRAVNSSNSPPRTISRTKLLTHKLVQGKRKRDGFLKGRKCFETRF